MHKLLYIIILCPLLSITIACEELPKAAQTAIEKTESNIADIKEEAQGKIDKENARLVKELTKIQEQATKSGKLAEAVAVQSKIASISPSSDKNGNQKNQNFEEFSRSVTVRSAGYKWGASGEINWNGESYLGDDHGLMVVIIHQGSLLSKKTFNTDNLNDEQANLLAQEIESAPDQAYIICAAKGEAGQKFNLRAQKALFSIGAKQGLLGQPYLSTSYVCIGQKGLAKGKAQEVIRNDGPAEYPAPAKTDRKSP